MPEATTRLLGLLGDPVAHSLSPRLHNYLIKRLDIDCRYLAFRVSPQDLSQAVQGLKALGAAGFNVTVPHKRAVLPLLDEVSPQAQALGAVNTVVCQDGKLVGHNTDWIGFLRPLQGVQLQGKSALILGAGGAANAVVYALIRSGIGRIAIVNRTLERARRLAEHARVSLGFEGVEALSLDTHALGPHLENSALLVNATSVGMWPKVQETPLSADALGAHLTVYDLIYNPLETRLLRESKAAGAHVIDGLDMFIGQGVAAFSLWTGVNVPESEWPKLRKLLRVNL